MNPSALRSVRWLVVVASLSPTSLRASEEAGRGSVYAVVEVAFRGPVQTPKDAPARALSFAVRFRHEAGSPEYTVHGFWDGDGKGGTAGDVFKVRFCPTRPGRWALAEVRSSAKELHGQRQGDFVTATPSKHPGFWEVDAEAAGGRWYKRSDGSHPYVVGNTHYSFLSGYGPDGKPSGNDIAVDVAANARYFKKLRFALTGDRYPHPAEKPFLDDEGKPTDAGDYSHRPNPRWFHQRVDRAVRTAYVHDLVADLILCGPDTEDSRATLRAKHNGGDPTPYLRYVAARYGSYPNVWVCLCNEYDIKTPRYPAADVARFGNAMRGFLPYPTPISVHASQFPDGKAGRGPAWSAKFDALPPWNDHQIIQRKLRAIAPATDVIRLTHENPSGKGPRNQPTVNDELSYQGDGDKHTEADTLASHLGAFLGGGYGSTGWKPGNKLGHYFWGKFDPQEHTAALGLKFLRESIENHVAFWKMGPDASAFPGLDPAFRAMAWPGREYVLGTDKAAKGVVANLPAGTWTVRRFDLVTRTETLLTDKASGRYSFDAPDSRAALFHFKKTGD
ncbi:MAG: DUF5060 domain-containing protein [Gemmataceae bacterium]|nr:DUF5060 domain-containing protein [Gemmataceae bacterium]